MDNTSLICRFTGVVAARGETADAIDDVKYGTPTIDGASGNLKVTVTGSRPSAISGTTMVEVSVDGIVKGLTVQQMKTAQSSLYIGDQKVLLHTAEVTTASNAPHAQPAFEQHTKQTFSQYLFETANHLREREFTSYSGWKAACRKIKPDVVFSGDKDICSAGSVGEWDGAVGVIYSQKVTESLNDPNDPARTE